MFDTSRRSAISISELGLYSDRSERHCHSKGFGTVVIKQFVIGIMIVITIVLIALFLYDVTSSTSLLQRQGQETNRIHILQNDFGKLNNTTTKNPSTSIPLITVNATSTGIQDRSDTVDQDFVFEEDLNNNDGVEPQGEETPDLEVQSRAQTLQNFQLRRKLLYPMKNQNIEQERITNHAVFRVQSSKKKPINFKDESYDQESYPSPFHYELKPPYPSSFKHQKYPQLSQYQYPHSSRSIQDIIKYLSDSPPNNSPRGIKFSGVYVSPKKYDTRIDVGEMMASSDDSEEEESAPFPVTLNGDPLYRYKPKHPADVNLLATSNVRFSPTGIQRYTQYQNPVFYPRPGLQTVKQPDYDSTGAFATNNNYGKKRSPKPFSVMLDIYPITDINEYKKTPRPRPQMILDDYEAKRPIQYIPRHLRNQALQQAQKIPIVTELNRQGMQDEEEKQQMILHLNLYPKKKPKHSRNDVIQKSEYITSEDRNDFMEKMMSPFQLLTKQLSDHFTIEKSKSEEDGISEAKDIPISRYEDIILERSRESIKDNDETTNFGYLTASMKENLEHVTRVPYNHRLNDLDNSITENQSKIKAGKLSTIDKLVTSTFKPMTTEISTTSEKHETSTDELNIDTVEGFQKFADGLIAVE